MYAFILELESFLNVSYKYVVKISLSMLRTGRGKHCESLSNPALFKGSIFPFYSISPMVSTETMVETSYPRVQRLMEPTGYFAPFFDNKAWRLTHLNIGYPYKEAQIDQAVRVLDDAFRGTHIHEIIYLLLKYSQEIHLPTFWWEEIWIWIHSSCAPMWKPPSLEAKSIYWLLEKKSMTLWASRFGSHQDLLYSQGLDR